MSFELVKVPNHDNRLAIIDDDAIGANQVPNPSQSGGEFLAAGRG